MKKQWFSLILCCILTLTTTACAGRAPETAAPSSSAYPTVQAGTNNYVPLPATEPVSPATPQQSAQTPAQTTDASSQDTAASEDTVSTYKDLVSSEAALSSENEAPVARLPAPGQTTTPTPTESSPEPPAGSQASLEESSSSDNESGSSESSSSDNSSSQSSSSASETSSSDNSSSAQSSSSSQNTASQRTPSIVDIYAGGETPTIVDGLLIPPSGSSSTASSGTSVTQPSGTITPSSNKPSSTSSSYNNPSEVRAVWLAYVNYRDVIQGMSRDQFTVWVNSMFANIKSSGFNTVFVQVRPFGDALYDSKYFPWSRFLTGTEGVNPGYDPLTIFCRLADANQLRIEAWINPYRVRTDNRTLSADNQAQKWLNANNSAVLSWNGGLYYNPANPEAQNLIINGVKEIVQNYDVDGIHFDDYFYPTTDMSFDQLSYRSANTQLSQADWRRQNVDTLIRGVYSAIKSIKPSCLFGISPQGNMDNNYNGQFIDVKKWVQGSGYIDYICPQIYFGFKNATLPFVKTVQQWDALITNPDVKLYVGLAAYKIGTTDQYAGASGQYEWANDKTILARMTEASRTAKKYGGVAIYNVDSILSGNGAQIKAEREALFALFK